MLVGETIVGLGVPVTFVTPVPALAITAPTEPETFCVFGLVWTLDGEYDGALYFIAAGFVFGVPPVLML